MKVTTNGHISLESKFLKGTKIVFESTTKMAIRICRMPYEKKWQKSESLSKHWMMMNKCRQHSNRCIVIWYMMLKWRTFRRKARLVAGGHLTEVSSATMTYASVVARESVRIALTLAALNDLEVKTADIENAYLTAPIDEKIWCTLGPEFGEDAGKRAIIVRALYGLKSAGASFCNHLADCMHHLGRDSCMADHDVWFKPEVRKDDGHQFYAYSLLYVDDILMVHHDSVKALREIDHFFKTKPNSIGDPEFYLGAKLRPMTLPNGVVAWGMSASKYVL
jgi:hypothetical protein